MKSILIVDDQNDVRVQAAGLLRSEGMLPPEIHEADSVASAIAAVCEHRPSLMLLDVVLPDGTGFDVLRALREKGIDQKTIMMTAFPQLDYALEAVNSKVIGFLVKPLNARDFSRAILAAQGAEDDQKQRHLAFTMLDVYLKGEQYNMQLDDMRESTGINRLHGAYYLALITSLERSMTLESRIMRFWALLRDAQIENVNYLQDTAALVVLMRDDRPGDLLPALERGLKEAFGSFAAGCAFSGADQGLRHAYHNAAFAQEYARQMELNAQIIRYESLNVPQILISRRQSGLFSGDETQIEGLMMDFNRQGVGPQEAAQALESFLARQGMEQVSLERGTLRQLGASLLNALKNSKKEEIGRKNFAQMARVKQYIARHYQENISRASIVESLGISYSYLGELFRTEMNQSVTEYIQGLKMQHAQELLQSTRLSVTEIARRVGYPDSRGFIRAFLRRYGVTPGEWRLQKKDGNA